MPSSKKLLSLLAVSLFGLPASLLAQKDSTVTAVQETRLAPSDTAPDGKVLVPVRSIITTTTTVTKKTVVYGKWSDTQPAAVKRYDSLPYQVVDTAALLKMNKWRKRGRLWTPPDSMKRVHGLFATFTFGPGTNRNGSPFANTDVAFAQRLSSGISKSFVLSYTRPKGFAIGITLAEMQRTSPTAVNAVTGGRLRYAGLIGGGRMASARNYNAQFLLMGGLCWAGQRYWIHRADRDIEVSSERPCLMIRPAFEVQLIRNLQLSCGVQALTSFYDDFYRVRKSPNQLDRLQPFSDGKESFFYYDVHVGLSYLLVK